MRNQPMIRVAALGALVAGLACGRNLDTMAKPDEAAANQDSTSQATSGYKGMARDTTLNGSQDSARTRPDEGQPVTAKGDTLNPGVDSSTTPGASTTSPSSTMDTSAAAVSPAPTSPTPSASPTDTTTTLPADSSGNVGVDTTGQMGNADTLQAPADSAR